MPFRLCTPAAQEPANRQLWTDDAGEVIGFAIIQLPFWTVDWGVRPGDETLHQEIVAWGVTRLTAIAKARGDSFFGFLLDSRHGNDPFALRHGFTIDDWYIRNLEMTITEPPLPPAIPAGFSLRPLNGQQEVAAYVDLHRAAFQSRNMTVEWRSNTISHPHYQPDLDLVAVAPDGRPAAFCIGWLDDDGGEKVGHIEPLGVLPEFQQQGLGRAILGESIQRFYQRGVRRVRIDVESNNRASQHLYETHGFAEINITYKYFRRFDELARQILPS